MPDTRVSSAIHEAFYASSWSVAAESLNTALPLAIELEKQVETLREQSAKYRDDGMIAHRWFAQQFGEVMNGRDFSVKCPMADTEVETLKIEREALHEAIHKSGKCPIKPCAGFEELE